MNSRNPGGGTAQDTPALAGQDAAAAAPLPAGTGRNLAGRAVLALREWAVRRPWLVAWLAFLPIAVLRAGVLAEADTFWQIRTGLVTLSTRSIPAVDTFTWTMHGKPWTLNSWGFNVAIAIAYKLAGLPAVAWACSALIMVIAALVLLLARHLGASPVVAGALLLLASPVLVGWLTARPQLADYIGVPALVMLLRRIAAGGTIGPVLAAGALSIIWVNVHAGALLGVVITAGCAILLLARQATRNQGGWCLAAAAAGLAGAFINPYGFGLISQTEQVQAASSGLIVEWQHFNPASPLADLSLLAGLLALFLAARRREPAFVSALAVCAISAAFAVRMLPFVDLAALPVLAAWASMPSPAVLRYARSRRVMFARCGAAGFLAFAVVAVPSLTHIGRPDLAKYPVRIVRDIPSGCRLFSTDLIGGFVILERPDVPVSLDTRNTLYGRRRLLALERVLAGQGNLTRGLAGAGCVLVPPGSGLARRLDNNPVWLLKASEPPAAVLFVRKLLRFVLRSRPPAEHDDLYTAANLA